MSDENPVTAVIIHYKTPDLIRCAVASLREFYPRLPLVIIDNGSNAGSAGTLAGLKAAHPDSTRLILNSENLHHGPAMDQALRDVHSPFLLFLDSDCRVTSGGFLEQMLEILKTHDNHYAAGKRVYMNRRGFDVPAGTAGAIPYIRPVCMLLKRSLYLTLPKFQRHGTPCLRNMEQAVESGLALIDFPVERYVHHEGRGTAGRHGYSLGWRGRLNYILQKLGI